VIRRGLAAVSWIKSEERLNAVGDEIISHSYCGEPAKSQENSPVSFLKNGKRFWLLTCRNYHEAPEIVIVIPSYVLKRFEPFDCARSGQVPRGD
jgi:hypothetical protein